MSWAARDINCEFVLLHREKDMDEILDAVCESTELKRPWHRQRVRMLLRSSSPFWDPTTVTGQPKKSIQTLSQVFLLLLKGEVLRFLLSEQQWLHSLHKWNTRLLSTGNDCDYIEKETHVRSSRSASSPPLNRMNLQFIPFPPIHAF